MEEEEDSATRRGRKPDSCGSSGGLLGAATRDAVAEEKSLISHSAGRGIPPRGAHARDLALLTLLACSFPCSLSPGRVGASSGHA